VCFRLAFFPASLLCSKPPATAPFESPSPPIDHGLGESEHAWAQADLGAPAAVVERWKDFRFGMFVHWGPVSMVGTQLTLISMPALSAHFIEVKMRLG
jgi:hypothetical protein